jgi:hypothetical protein
MKTFDQKFVREVAQDVYDQRMRTEHIGILQSILREAERGEFSAEFKREDITLECVYWLKDKGFEIYTDTGNNDDWFELEAEDFDSVFRANRIKVVW